MNLNDKCHVDGCDKKVNGGLHCHMHRVRMNTYGMVNPPRKKKVVVTPDMEAEVVKLIRKFMSPIDVAKRVGISVSVVREIMKRATK